MTNPIGRAINREGQQELEALIEKATDPEKKRGLKKALEGLRAKETQEIIDDPE